MQVGDGTGWVGAVGSAPSRHAADLARLNQALTRLERSWTDQIRYRL